MEFMLTREGLSLKRKSQHTLRVTYPGTDVSASVDFPKRRKNPAGGLFPRTERSAYVGAVMADSRFPGQPPLTKGTASPTGFLKLARAGTKGADRAKITIRAEAGWFGPRASKGSGAPNYRADSDRLTRAYRAVGMKPDGEAIRNELRGYANLRDRQQVARMIRAKPPLVRYPR